MSIQNFIPTIWSARLLQHLDKAHVAASLVNRDYEGEITNYGDTVKINQIGDITVRDYEKNQDIVTQELDGNQTTLLIDQSKYFSFLVDDVDAAQVNPKLVDAAMQRAAYGLADETDIFILSKYTEAGSTLGTTAEPIDVTEDNAIRVIVNAGKELNKKNVPTAGRWMVVDPEFHAKLVMAKLIADTSNSETVANGYVGRIGGFDIHLSNNVQVQSDVSKIIAGTNAAISFAEQIVKTEAFRKEKGFGDGVKGLHVYGGKVVQPNALVTISAVYDETGVEDPGDGE